LPKGRTAIFSFFKPNKPAQQANALAQADRLDLNPKRV
jgi:hypothetical protein